MKKLNIIMIIICIILILVNLYVQNDINEFKRNTPGYGSATSGTGVTIYFLIVWAINSIVTSIILLITIFAAIKTKSLLKVLTLLTISLIIFTFCFPILL